MEHYKKIALFGGVYNNYLALQELLRECQELDVEAIFCMGDIGGFGPHPDRSFPLLRSGAVHCIAGNYDISLAQGKDDCGCGYSDPLDNQFAQISYEYTFQHTSKENKSWLGTLPTNLSFYLGPLKVHLCHGSPSQINEFLWESTSPNHLLSSYLARTNADIVCCTHTGLKWHRELPGQKHFFNVGVIGRPENDGRSNVWYILLEYSASNFRFEFRPLIYDHHKLARQMLNEGLPPEFAETTRSGWWTTCLEIMPARERKAGRF